MPPRYGQLEQMSTVRIFSKQEAARKFSYKPVFKVFKDIFYGLCKGSF
jgi:hypothetical protein